MVPLPADFISSAKKGGQWIEVTKMTPPGGKNDHQYGFAIAIKGDTIVVTARRADPAGVKNAGAVYIYSLKGDSVNLVTTLTPSNIKANDESASRLPFVGDALAVGAWKDDIDANHQGSIIFLPYRWSMDSERDK